MAKETNGISMMVDCNVQLTLNSAQKNVKELIGIGSEYRYALYRLWR